MLAAAADQDPVVVVDQHLGHEIVSGRNVNDYDAAVAKAGVERAVRVVPRQGGCILGAVGA